MSSLTGNRILFLGAITGIVGAFWSYNALVDWLGITLTVPIVLACLVISAFSGIGLASLADEHGRFRWLALVAAIFVGMLASFVAYLIFSFLAGPT